MRYCLHDGCSVIVPRGFCQKHERHESDRPDPQVREWYHSLRWRKVRAWKLAQSPDCEACAVSGRSEPATDVDHIEPHRGRASVFWNHANLRSLCHRCHARKTRSEQIARLPV
jgi:5-methylcytosine-specific restriction protein A